MDTQGRSKRAVSRKESEIADITIHGDSGHMAVNVKMHRLPEVKADEAERGVIYDCLTERFWEEAQDVAVECGYSGVFGEGRSDGWCVPFYQYDPSTHALRKFHLSHWDGQGGSKGYPSYPDTSTSPERKRFLRFDKAIRSLITELVESYIEQCGGRA